MLFNERHEYVDSHTFKIHPSIHKELDNWRDGNDLGKIVVEVSFYFKAFPPTPLSPVWSSVSNTPWANLDNLTENEVASIFIDSSDCSVSPLTPDQTLSRLLNNGDTFASVLNTANTNLEGMSIQELELLVNDSSKFDAFVNSLEYVKEFEEYLRKLKLSNLKVQETNINMEEALKILSQKIVQLDQEFDQNKKKLEGLIERKGRVEAMHSYKALIKILETSAVEEEKEAENVADRFLNGQIEVSEFLENFLNHKKSYYVRKSKIKMLELAAK
ncbi:vacuolar protein sorting-associated protein 37C-like [Schistocerca gregaria]|uniref:vacuolar protein sorting-associated protein 37C-like n=1 Tax=Schistocerca gregaria TaxID=7010 RepID=UPI00211ECB51|nr:vacuolar protein sorting-associated protein 37C-like [Schistocerca gregaria]